MLVPRKIVEQVRKEYPIDCRVELVKMDDAQAPPIGTRGTVRGVDDQASILVAWDNGCGLNVVYDCDIVKKLDSVVVVTYGQKQIWDSREEAIKFYFEGMVSCEGAERERYTNIYIALTSGKAVCWDEDQE